MVENGHVIDKKKVSINGKETEIRFVVFHYIARRQKINLYCKHQINFFRQLAFIVVMMTQKHFPFKIRISFKNVLAYTIWIPKFSLQILGLQRISNPLKFLYIETEFLCIDRRSLRGKTLCIGEVFIER